MIRDTTNFDGFHFVLPRNAAKEWPEAVAQFWFDQWAAFLGAEHAMVVGTDVGHAGIQPFTSSVGNTKFIVGGNSFQSNRQPNGPSRRDV